MIKKRKKILIIEDDLAIIDIYKTFIKKANFDVEVISSGEEAIRMIKEISINEDIKPDIVLIDLVLPDINGIEVFRAIKKSDKTRNIKVFILTNQEISVDWFDNSRPEEFLIKANTTPTNLLKIIKKYLKK